jgi:hypothetical protein
MSYIKGMMNYNSNNNIKPMETVGGAYSEVKIADDESKKDKLKNFSIIKTTDKTGNKISQDKLRKFINLKI